MSNIKRNKCFSISTNPIMPCVKCGNSADIFIIINTIYLLHAERWICHKCYIKFLNDKLEI